MLGTVNNKELFIHLAPEQKNILKRLGKGLNKKRMECN